MVEFFVQNQEVVEHQPVARCSVVEQTVALVLFVLVPENLVFGFVEAHRSEGTEPMNVSERHPEVFDQGLDALVDDDGHAVVFFDQRVQNAYIEFRKIHARIMAPEGSPQAVGNSA